MKQEQHTIANELAGLASAREARELAAVADVLMQTPKVKRSPAAQRSGWRLLEARMQETLGTRKPKWYAWRWVFVAVPALALLVVGIITISMHAVPGDATYAVKRRVEAVQLTLAFTDAKRADACSVLMKRRANELAILSGDKLKTSTVYALNGAIKEEAEEFAEYAEKSGGSSARLQQQRVRDAQYVIDALSAAQQHTKNADQLSSIKATQKLMQTIVEQNRAG